MHCPKCTSELFTFDIDGIALEQCNSCEGMWLDKDELRQVKDKANSDLNWMDFEVWKYVDKFKEKQNKYNCPKCGSNLHALDYDETNIEIDYCESCHGIWLDKGEIQQLVNELGNELLTMPLNEYIKSSIEEAKELLIGDESFISEWKDFSTILRFLQYRILVNSPQLAANLIKIQQSPLNN